MNTYSQIQSILLKQLGIAPLEAKPAFFVTLSAADKALKSTYTVNDYSVSSTNENTVKLAENPRFQAILATQLAEDINTTLVQTKLSDWQIDALAKDCQVCEQILITPPLPQLQQVTLKRQLWQLLSEQLHD